VSISVCVFFSIPHYCLFDSGELLLNGSDVRLEDLCNFLTVIKISCLRLAIEEMVVLVWIISVLCSNVLLMASKSCAFFFL